MKKYDIVIIGSGLGGLVCGYILSKNGYKIGIFEKHFQLGGCMQTFERKGITFDTGMHYIGSMEPGQSLHSIFKYLNLLEVIKLQKLDEDGFDKVFLNGKEYKFAMGYENFLDTMVRSFPDEREALVQYVLDLQKFTDSSPILNPEKLTSNAMVTSEALNMGIGDYLDSLTKNKELQNVLSGTNMLFAGDRDKTPLYIHSVINDFYIRSAYRIVGGASTIVDSLSKSIEQMGGELFTRSEVVSINSIEDKVNSITLANGEIIESDFIISNTHPEITLNMLDTPLIKKFYRERIKSLEHTISSFTLYLEFKPNTVPYFNYNVYKYNNTDVWDCASYTANDWPRNYILMHQVPKNDIRFAESAVIITYMQFSEVEKWINTTIEKRGIEYKEFKKEKKELILQQFERDYPGIRDNIKEVYTSSPLTIRDYTGSKNGSMYGILKDKDHLEQTLVSHRTKLSNLFFTGQNANIHGILGVAVSAIITSSEFVELKKIVNEIFNNSKV